jgi:uncharacterized membrane protein
MALPPIPSELHPVLNHVPIVLLPLAAVLATAGRTREWAWKASGLVLVLAAVGAIATVLTGMEWASGMAARLQGARAATLGTHRLLGIVTATLSVALAGLHLWKKDALRGGRWALVWPALLWLAALLVLATAWYGGALAFERPAGGFPGGFGGLRGNGTAPPPA